MKWTVVLIALALPAAAQPAFGPPQVITTSALNAECVHAADLDGDGDADVLSASWADDKIAWYENLGNGTFGPQQIITTSAAAAGRVHAADLDNDGDTDVLSASAADNKIAWYRNLGGGMFSTQVVITTAAQAAQDVCPTDLDGDGDMDVLSASYADDKIAWYENLGGGTFGPQQVITTAANGAASVHTADLDNDGDRDVLSASVLDDKIAWYENLGGGAFGPQQIITTNAAGASCVHAGDLDGDGVVDVLSASYTDDKIAVYMNLGGGTFGPQQVLSGPFGSPTSTDGAQSVCATDLDADGDADVLSASGNDQKIAWYENIGGVFATQQVLTSSAPGARSVCATDLDGDGDRDVLSASFFDHTIAWYEDLMGIPAPPCPSGSCLDLIGTATISNTPSLLLQTPATNSPCYVFADTQTGAVPLGTLGFSQIAFTPNLVAVATPSPAFGGSLAFPYTDANGEWAFAFPIPNDPTLIGFSVHLESYVFDVFPPLPPNGLFWQSNLLSLTIQ